MVQSAHICRGCEHCAVNTNMRNVHTSATEREGIQERCVCSSQVGPCRFINETCRAREQNCSRILLCRMRINALEDSRTVDVLAAERGGPAPTKPKSAQRPLEWHRTGLTLRQAVRNAAPKNSSMRSRRTTRLTSQSFKACRASTKEELFEGIDYSCNLSLGCKSNEAPEPMDSQSSNDISAKITSTNRPCAKHDCPLLFENKAQMCICVFDRCRNYSYRFASDLRLMFLQTANKTDTDPTPTAANRTNKTTNTK